ncbi:hypothetical protein BR93DRAFT_177636 [Coniochaeta sp. PMI_546]|nr:hypothetical protein BR93DRAFT_177636 [Coniochaeta sp. PMI_546]
MRLDRVVPYTVDAAVATCALSSPRLSPFRAVAQAHAPATTALSGNHAFLLDHIIRWTFVSVAREWTHRPLSSCGCGEHSFLFLHADRQTVVSTSLWLSSRFRSPYSAAQTAESRPTGRGYTRHFLHSPHRASTRDYPFLSLLPPLPLTPILPRTPGGCYHVWLVSESLLCSPPSSVPPILASTLPGASNTSQKSNHPTAKAAYPSAMRCMTPKHANPCPQLDIPWYHSVHVHYILKFILCIRPCTLYGGPCSVHPVQ